MQWRYSDVRIIFDGLSLDRPGQVVRVLAQPLSGLRTSEGFTAGGTAEEFRRAYQAYWVASVGDRPLATLTVNGIDARVMPAVSLRSGCGLATTDCIEYRFQVPGEAAYVYVLQGPAGCCLDWARPNATLGVEIRPGVRGQLIPNQDEFGGPILWWVEETAPGSRVYVALSGPNVADGELIKIARSMRPLQR